MAGFNDAMAGALDYLAEGEKRKRDKQIDLNNEKERLKFAKELEIQAYQAKMQLAHQFPTYSHFVTSPVTGKTTGYDNFGNAKVMPQSEDDAAAYKNIQERADAKLAKDEERAAALNDQTVASADYARQHAAYLKDRMDHPDKYKRSGSTKQIGITPKQILDQIDKENKGTFGSEFTPLTPEQRKQKYDERVKFYKAQHYPLITNGVMDTDAPENTDDDEEEMPDLSNLMGPFGK